MYEIFQTDRSKKVFALVFYIVVLVGIFIYLMVVTNKMDMQTEEYNEKFNFVIDFDYVKNALLNSDYNESIFIQDGGLINYELQKKNGELFGELKYSDKNIKIKDVNDLYKKYPLLSIKLLLSYFENDFTKNNNTFLYENETIYVKIIVSVDNIVEIHVNETINKEEKIEYILEFRDITDFKAKR